MFTNISWPHYLMTVSICLGVYYVWVSVQFYSDEFKNKLSRFKMFKPNNLKEENSINKMDSYKVSAGPQKEPVLDIENIFGVAMDNGGEAFENCIWRITEATEDAAKRKLIKEEVCTYLSGILKDYPELKETGFQLKINELIIRQCNKVDAIILDKKDVLMLWNRVG